MQRWARRGVYVLGASALAACGAFGSDTDGAPTGGSPDASAEASSPDAPDAPDAARPATGFLLTLDPPHVTADYGDNVAVNIHVVRAPSFTQIVTLAVSGGPVGVTSTIPNATQGDDSSFVITFAAGDGGTAPMGDAALTVTGFGGEFQALVTLGLRVGSLLVPESDGTLQVPPFATNGLDVKAWGAGGGGFINYSGAGGFASARVLVVPNEKLFVDVGTPGGTGSATEGGGGGFSALRRGTSTYLLIAGGGGGGGVSVSGGAGGGAVGQPSLDMCGGGGGTQSAGGGAPMTCGTPGKSGSLYQGGNATFSSGSAGADGGIPGGGMGAVGVDVGSGVPTAGGGGGGYYGGGGGGDKSGGGGGSSWVGDAGPDATLVAGIGVTPPKSFGTDKDPDYEPPAGKPSFPGRVVLRLPKPN